MVTTESDGKTWEEALNECRNGPGFLPDLASIRNADEQGGTATQNMNKNVHFSQAFGTDLKMPTITMFLYCSIDHFTITKTILWCVDRAVQRKCR